MKDLAKRLWSYLFAFLRWIVLAAAVGAVCGLVGTLFSDSIGCASQAAWGEILLRQGNDLLLRRMRYALRASRPPKIAKRLHAAGLETAAPCADGRQARACGLRRFGKGMSLGRKDYHAAVGKPFL